MVAFQELLSGKEISTDRTNLTAVTSQSLSQNPSVAIKGPNEGRDISTVSMNETVFIGDSLTVRMKPYIKGAAELYKGAKQTGWMRQQFDDFLKHRNQGANANMKRIVILGGINDITSLRSVEYVKANITYMINAAKAVGLEVVVCTIPKWDMDKYVPYIVRDWKRCGWKPYPLSAKQLEDRTVELNNWILGNPNIDSAVDLYTEMSDYKKYPRADSIHPSGKGSKAMVVRQWHNI